MYVAPRLSEDDRIVRSCPNLRFRTPDDEDRDDVTKLSDLKMLMHHGRNVAITHALFALCDENVCDLMKEQGYTLIIDEVVNILSEAKLTQKDVEAMITNGFASVDKDGYVTVAPDYVDGEHGDAFRAALNLARSHKLFLCGRQKYYTWVVSDRMLRAAEEVYVLTYKFEKSSMIRLLKESDLEYSRIYVDSDGAGDFWFAEKLSFIPSYVGHLSNLIKIVDIPRLNGIGDDPFALSKSWWEKQWKEYKHLTDYDHKTKTYQDTELSKNTPMGIMRRNIYSYFMYEHRDIPAEDKLCGGFKITENCIKRKGFLDSFLVFNATAINDYGNRHFLVDRRHICPKIIGKAADGLPGLLHVLSAEVIDGIQHIEDKMRLDLGQHDPDPHILQFLLPDQEILPSLHGPYILIIHILGKGDDDCKETGCIRV